MNREEILSKVTKDNNGFDEMEIATIIKALGLSTIVVPVFCLIFMIIRITKGTGVITDLIAITFSQLTVYEIYRYFMERKKGKLFLSIIFSIITIASIIMFFFEV
ncbi:MAG: hypothetical protein IJJ82_06870 [Clostridia bacterium]|nr:hypothetical protein [Clostridia bacterium]